MIDQIKKIQEFVKVTVDGDFGSRTTAAVAKALLVNPTIKSIQKAVGVKEDGELGPLTINAIFVKFDLGDENFKNVITKWPNQNYASMVKFYGDVGENQTTLILPYKMYLAWDTDSTIHKISCHEKVHDPLKRIFENTLNHYGLDKIKELKLDCFGGCLNVRKMRGGSSWSIHSWGAAIDLDPDRNQLKWGKNKANLAKPEYEPFWKIVEGEGAISLGKTRDIDWMHIQFANL